MADEICPVKECLSYGRIQFGRRNNASIPTKPLVGFRTALCSNVFEQLTGR